MSGSLLLSYREAARALGIGRGGSLHELIARGLLRPVTLLGKQKIPREQVEDLARNGDKPAAPQTPAISKRKKRAGASIAALKL